MKRRAFIKRSAASGAVLGFPTIIPSTVLGRNGKTAPGNRAVIGLIGCGFGVKSGRIYQSYEKSEIVAVCDPRKNRRDAYARKLFNNCDTYNDFRELLDRKDIDGVHIATQDHWHVPIAIMAARAGKDVYTEQPLGISINHDLESRRIVDKYERIFQYGAQQRSQTHVRLGIELALNGHIGEVKEVYVWAPPGRSGGNPAERPVPRGFDFNMWLGPAPEVPYCSDRVTRGFYHIYDHAIGSMASQGAHPMDMLQWWADNADMKEIPVKYEGTGKWKPEDLYNTISNWDVHCTYANGLTLRFMDSHTSIEEEIHEGVFGGMGTLLVGTDGWVNVSRGGWKCSSEELSRKAKDPGETKLKVSRNQVRNFVDGVLARETPVDDLHSAVRSDIVCHLSDIAIRTGKTVEWDPKQERIEDEECRKLMYRELRKPWTL